MRTISLVSLTLENFRSFRQPTTLMFSRSPGFRFMTGRNAVEPGLGANGAGKSSTWHGLTWVNFGTSIDDQRSSDLTTWGEKKPRGTCIWDIDGELATIERAGNPNYLALNGESTTQQVIDRILGRSKKQFVQTVLFGQGARTFVDLSIPERAAVLDDVLDLNLWLTLSETAGKRVSGVEKQIDEISRLIAFDDGRLASLPNDEELNIKVNDWEESRRDKINAMITEVEDTERVMAELIETSNRLKNRTRDHNDITDQEKLLQHVREEIDKSNKTTGGLLSQTTALQKTITFFSDHPANCPTCNQRITAQFARQVLADERQEMKGLIELNKRNAATVRSLLELRDNTEAEYNKSVRILEHLQSQIRETDIRIENQNALILRLAREIDRLGNEQNPWSKQIEQNRHDRIAVNEHRQELVTNKQSLEGSTLTDGFWRDGFKRVRLFEISRILTHLELEIENQCGMLGLYNWRINVTTETENKTRGVRHGVQIQVTSPESSAPWESWSGGEGQRIRLAIALGFASLIERMTAVRYSIEVWDEPSSFLSSEGIDDFLACMRNRVDTEHKALWLIDCGVMANTSFDEVWQMTKTAEGSQLSLIASDE